MQDPDEVLSRFASHEVSPGQQADILDVRAGFQRLVSIVLAEVPAGREQAIVLTKLEEAAFFAVAAIARHP